MALVQIGSLNSLDSLTSTATALAGSNTILSYLGLDSTPTPLSFFNKFTSSSVFDRQSLACTIRGNKNFDVIFHWNSPSNSQIRTYFANAFGSSDTDDIRYWVQRVMFPRLQNSVSPYSASGNSMDRLRGQVVTGTVNGAGSFTMSILSTEFSLVDHCFYQWLSETESPFWIYTADFALNKEQYDNLNNCQQCQYEYGKNLPHYSSYSRLYNMSAVTPFTKADIEIKYYSGNLKPLHSIWIWGAFPQQIELSNVDHNSVDKIETRNVVFAFDSISISSPFIPDGTSKSTISSSLQGLTNGGYWSDGLTEDLASTFINKTIMTALSKKLTRKNKESNEHVKNIEQKYEKKFYKVGDKVNKKLGL